VCVCVTLQPFGPCSHFSFLILYTVGRTPWAGNQPVARPLPTHRTTETQNKRTQISMPRVALELTTPVFERAKTVHALGRPHTNCVKTSIKTWDKKDKSWRQHHNSDRCAAVFIISFVSTVLLSLRHVADIVSWVLHVLTHAGVRPTLDRAVTVIGVYVNCCVFFNPSITTNSLINKQLEARVYRWNRFIY
jgi:hypothetical protein